MIATLSCRKKAKSATSDDALIRHVQEAHWRVISAQ